MRGRRGEGSRGAPIRRRAGGLVAPGAEGAGRGAQAGRLGHRTLAGRLGHWNDGAMVAALVGWFRVARRELPWRPPYHLPRDPYHALVSEAMLQQTQVSRVLEFFPRFIARFPSVAALAEADEGDVLAAWAGLGYYRRARNLQAAARVIVERFGGRVPGTVEELRTLPGVGRYTAGALASIVFGRAEPAVDGNVVRVMLRVHGRDLDPGAKETVEWVWDRAGELSRAAGELGSHGAGEWNEGLMDLGATVCVPPPGKPMCLMCPLREACVAAREGTQHGIPRAKKRAKGDTVVHAAAVVVRDGRGRVLLEQRPATGLWASMWQVPTLERGDRAATEEEVSAFARMRGCAGAVERVGAFTHQTSHRRVEFVVYRAAAAKCGRKTGGRVWAEPAGIGAVAVSNAQRRVMGMAGVVGGAEEDAG